MSRTLDRLLHLRALLEEVSRAELERRLRNQSRIEEAQRREQSISLQLRQKSLALLLAGGETAPVDDGNQDRNRGGNGQQRDQRDRRAFAESDRQASDQRRDRLVGIAADGSVQVEKAQREFLTRRGETRTLESLIRNQKAQREWEQNRRDQQQLDDWFAGKQIRDRRKRTRTGQS